MTRPVVLRGLCNSKYYQLEGGHHKFSESMTSTGIFKSFSRMENQYLLSDVGVLFVVKKIYSREQN